MTTPTSDSITGAILAGGQSRRMGQPKEGVLMADGRRMIEHVIEPLSHICQKILIVGACRGFTIPPQSLLIPLPDSDPGSGPLSAIATILKSGVDKKGYIITACDQPFLTADLLRLLIQGPLNQPCIFKNHDSPLQPFPGYYPVSWLPEIGERSVCAMLTKTAISLVACPKEWEARLKNINRPTDL